MKRYISLLMGILGFVPILAQQSDYYYYYKGERIYLTVDSTRLYVVSEGEFQPQGTARSRATEYTISNSSKSYVYNNVVLLQKQRAATPEVYFSTLDVPKGTTASQYDALIDKVKVEKNVWQVLPSFTSNGKPLNISNNFYVELKSAEDFTKLQQLAARYGIEIIGNNEFMPLWYTLSCTPKSSKSSIEAANLFQESQLFECSEPEFCYTMSLNSEDSSDEFYIDDPYYPSQWNLKNTGQDGGIAGIDINVEEAWETTKGEGVVVAVFDQGSYAWHEDLAGQFSRSYNAITGEGSSVIVRNKAYMHGTNCAGIIGAKQNNGIGLSGVAPEVELVDISIDLGKGFTSQQAANGFNWARKNGADVISCSWGGIEQCNMIDLAIDSALCLGRGGNGCIVVFAAGNMGDSIVSYPANSDSRILAVGGITPLGKRSNTADYLEYGINLFNSNYGEHLDVVAPSILIPTTSVYIDEWGFSYNRYVAGFKGTSAACPHVAGVAALILSVAPNMTVEDVEYVIEKTARKIRTDLYSYQKDSLHTFSAWNKELGYGLVDATAAVKMAERYAASTCVWNRVFDNYGHGWGYFEGSKVDVQDVKVDSSGVLTLIMEKNAILKSSVCVKKGGQLIIYLDNQQ